MTQSEIDRARLQALTGRERDCLRLVLEQLSSKEIGRKLGISPTSVDTHVRRAREKLGVDDRYAAAQLLAAWERDAASVSSGSRPSARPSTWRGWPPPPLTSLSLLQRLMLVVLFAVLGAIAFGAVLTALAAL
jgi:DNA-binding CsgD family transcriptional regulator